MLEVLEIEIDFEEKVLYIGTECGSGAKYHFKNKNELGIFFQEYVDNYIEEE